MQTQAERGQIFRALHERLGAFVIPNPWDVGTARILAKLGFEALATTSAGFAFSVGTRDNSNSRDEVMEHVRAIVEATELPVSADLGNAFGDDPSVVAETFRQAVAAGLAGASVEDMTGRRDELIYDIGLATERVRAASEVTRALGFPFMLTARAENYLIGRQDLGDTIKRLQAYQEAGADVLYAPGLTTREDIAAIVTSVDRPVNVIAGIAGMTLTVAELSGLGVKRISTGSTLARAAIGAFVRAAREINDNGTFTFGADLMSFGEINAMFKP